jgi:hypothetical protein
MLFFNIISQSNGTKNVFVIQCFNRQFLAIIGSLSVIVYESIFFAVVCHALYVFVCCQTHNKRLMFT